MPIHDYIIDNGTGAAVRADINLALSAIVSLNSSASEPGTMYAYQLWADTTSNLLKIRNSGNSAWITLRQLDGDFSIVAVEDGLQATPSLTFTNDLNTGIFRPGNDSLAIVTGATRAITITSTQAVGIQTANPSTALHVAGNARVGADDVTDAHLQIGKGATGNRNSYIDIVADTTYTDYGLRVIRNNTGANATSELKHRGTGALNFTTEEAAPIVFNTTNSPQVTIDSSGRLLVGTSTATGAHLLQVNSDALINGIAVGRGLASISTNTAVGSGALSDNTTGSNNVANGYQALYFNTTGAQNTAIGYRSLYNTTTGNYNIATGSEALYFNTTGTQNTANGLSALTSNTTGGNNTAIGFQALYSNTTASRNTANGHKALFSNTTGAYGTAGGYNALYSNTTGDGNTALGYEALYGNTTGINNTSIGFQTSANTNANTTGSNNIFFGYGATGASATASNVITLGNSSIATLRCQVTTITALSDSRDKTNITNIPAGLDFINALRPVAFDWNMRDGAKVGIHEFGFIAQELQEAQASTGITVPNLVSTENPDKLEASAGTLLPVLVNAVQELTAMVRDLQAELSILKGA
jgi:trimeric autotransporter adhesin